MYIEKIATWAEDCHACYAKGAPCAEHARPGWDEYFMGIADAVAARADCRRGKHGCIIVDENKHIIGGGYNGSPPGDDRSCLKGDCPRGLLSKKERPSASMGGHDFTDCIALHAEQNAIANATAPTKGATVYLIGKTPCDMCSKLLQAAGIARVVVSG